jgi:hypothetical protein
MTDRETLEERFAPKHLQTDEEAEVKTAEDFKQEVEEMQAPTPADPEKDPRSKKEYPFDLDWIDGRGKHWTGKFVNRILSIGDRQKVGMMRAHMAGNVPYEALDPETAEINLIVAHVTFSLTEKPSWARDLLAVEDPALLRAIYAEVVAHEATFLGF